MALRRPPTTFSDSIDAADLAANSVTSSELADNAVDEAAIAANAVTTAKIADSSSTTTGITPAKIAENAVTSAKIATGAVIADGIGAGAVVAAGLGAGAVTAPALGDVIEVKPHIIPGVLYPAVANIMVDGTTALSAVTTGPNSSTVASSKYGTVQSDGRMYYYTDIKGSKPIKDPRIGAHFGSQRHKFKSVQLLEQETATSGAKVYSIDGRNWIRKHDTQGGGFANNNDGVNFQTASANDTTFWEVTGYFNGINWIGYTASNAMYGFKWSLDGSAYTTNSTASNSFNTTVETPLKDRYVDAGSLLNIPLSTTLGIHTFKISLGGAHYGCELIAQDKFTDATCDYNNDPTIAHDANTRILAGMSVTGTGIPTGAKVATVTSTTAFELSASTTGGAVTNGTLTFGTTEISIPS